MTPGDRSADAPPRGTTDRWHLEDEAQFLRRSLADAEAEHRAGDLSDEDHRLLRRRDKARLAVVEAELVALDDAPGPAPPPGAGVTEAKGSEEDTTADGRAHGQGSGGGGGGAAHVRRRRRPVLALVGVTLIVAGLVLLVIHLTSPRLLGETASGTVDVNAAQRIDRQLAQAAQLVDQGTTGSIEEGLAVYRYVLKEDPRQPQALAETGYLEWEAGFESGQQALAAEGRALVNRSLRVEQDDYAAHLFAGTIDLRQGGDPSAAAAQFRLFLSERPPPSLVRSAAPAIRAAYAAAHQPLPPGVPAGS